MVVTYITVKVSPYDSDELVCCINLTEFVIKSYPERSCIVWHFMVHMLHKNEVNHQHIFVAFLIEMLLHFIKFQVKLINYDGKNKSSAIILISLEFCEVV